MLRPVRETNGARDNTPYHSTQRAAPTSDARRLFPTFEYNRGVQIDHFLLTSGLVKRLKSCEIDKRPRSLEKPSDHTPIVL
jgi:hypothetical protein